MPGDGLYIFIIFIVVITIIIVGLTWIPVVRNPPQLPPAPQLEGAGYGMRCVMGTPVPSASGAPQDFTPQPCMSGLSCIKVIADVPWGFCKKSVGQPCITVSECEPDALYCTGVCSKTLIGGFNQVCKTNNVCDTGLTCRIPAAGGSGICKLNPGTSGCAIDSDCNTGTCIFEQNSFVGICRTQYDNGHVCTNNFECLSNNCDTTGGSGSCQPQGISTGSVGAGCTYYQQAPPTCNPITTPTGTSKSTCFIDTSTLPTLTPDQKVRGIGTYGVCTFEETVWSGGLCSTSQGCIPPTVCYAGSCVMPRTTTLYRPNSCSIDDSSGICSPGYSCSSSAKQCIPSTASVPALPLSGGESKWSVLKWSKDSSNPAGSWSAVAGATNITPPAPTPYMTALSLPQGDIIIYQINSRDIRRFYLVPLGGRPPVRLNITGPYNGTQLIGASPATNVQYLYFTVLDVKLTPGGNVAIQYAWLDLMTGTLPTRVTLQPIPDSWRSTTLPPETELHYQITWAGMTPNTDIDPGSPQQSGAFLKYRSPSGQVVTNVTISWDIDDRPDAAGNIRTIFFTQSDVSGGGRSIVLASSPLSAINTALTAPFQFTPTSAFYTWAQFYSNSRTVQDINAYLFTTVEQRNQIQISITGTQPSITIPPSDIPIIQVVRPSLYSPIGGSLGGSRLFYGAEYSNGFVYRLYDGVDLVLPGYFNPNSMLAVTQKDPSIDPTTFIPNYYVVTTTI